MQREDIILTFDIVPDRSPELETVTRALTHWVEGMRTAASVIDPGTILSVELVGVEPGSQKFRLALKRLEEGAVRIKYGATEYPLISKFAMTLAMMVPASLVSAGVTNLMSSYTHLAPEQMSVIKKIGEDLSESVALQRRSMDLFGVLQDDPAIDAVKIIDGESKKALCDVQRRDFAARSGL